MTQNRIEELKALEVKPAINKEVREAWKIVYPVGTCPRKTTEVKEDVIDFITRFENGTNPDFIDDKKIPFLSFIDTLIVKHKKAE